MGYRSEVKFMFYPEEAEHFPVMKLWLDENMPGTTKGQSGYALLERSTYDEDSRPYIFYTSYDVKWYEGYTEVDAVMRAIEDFNNLFCGEDATTPCNYEYVRIGEETEDIEQRFSDNAEFRMHVRREVMVD